MTLDDLASTSGEWLRGSGPESDIVISSRIRLARNLADFPFISRATDADRADAFDQSWGLDGLGNFSSFDDDGDSQTRTANSVNEITNITGGWITPSFDDAGNMISGPKPGDETTRVHYVYDAWNRLMPWFVVFEGARSETSQVDVQIGRMSVQWFSLGTRQWHLLDTDAGWEVSMCPQASNYFRCPMGETFTGPDGRPTFTNGNGRNGHGWFEMLELPDPRDVGALTVTVEARKVGHGADRSQLLLQTGADIYPPAGTPIDGIVLPGAAISSMRLVGTDWTAVTMTTFAEQTRNGTGITMEDLRRHPPPCARPEALAGRGE